ncbi:UNVERIFIED_CONTAM: hypothetical protein FKN15_055951, partial [Acipenser sinensis]
IHKAQVIIDYNAIKGGVDRSDQLLKYYNFLRKTIKWYKKLAFYLIDVAFINAHILYSQKQQKLPSLLSFCMSLVKQILHSTDPSAGDQGGRPSTTVHPVRLTARHFPSHPLRREQGSVSMVQSVQCGLWSRTSAGRVKKVNGEDIPVHTLQEHSTWFLPICTFCK